ncbi:MAG: hypothetical protein ACEPOZ_09300 [Marinifilaceae bacterium]
MYAKVDKSEENKSRAVANSVAQKKGRGKKGLGLLGVPKDGVNQINGNYNCMQQATSKSADNPLQMMIISFHKDMDTEAQKLADLRELDETVLKSDDLEKAGNYELKAGEQLIVIDHGTPALGKYSATQAGSGAPKDLAKFINTHIRNVKEIWNLSCVSAYSVAKKDTYNKALKIALGIDDLTIKGTTGYSYGTYGTDEFRNTDWLDSNAYNLDPILMYMNRDIEEINSVIEDANTAIYKGKILENIEDIEIQVTTWHGMFITSFPGWKARYPEKAMGNIEELGGTEKEVEEAFVAIQNEIQKMKEAISKHYGLFTNGNPTRKRVTEAGIAEIRRLTANWWDIGSLIVGQGKIHTAGRNRNEDVDRLI